MKDDRRKLPKGVKMTSVQEADKLKKPRERKMREILREKLQTEDETGRSGAEVAMDALAVKMMAGEIPALRLGLEMLDELRPANNIHVDELKSLSVIVSGAEAGENLKRILLNEKEASYGGNEDKDEQVLR